VSERDAHDAARRIVATDEGWAGADEEIDYLDSVAVARFLLMPPNPGPAAREAEVTVLARKPGLRALVQFANGDIRYAETARLRTLPPGTRRLTDAELRAIPWDETRHGPDPLKQTGQLFDHEVRA